MTEEINRAREALHEAKEKMMGDNLKKDRSNIVASVASEVVRMFSPIMEMMLKIGKVNKDELTQALSNIRVQTDPITVSVPEVNIPPFDIPEPRVTVMPAPVNIPATVFPDEMDIKGFVNLMINDTPVGLDNPLAVTLRNSDGSPMDLLSNLTSIVGGGGSGGARIVKVSNLDEISITTTGLTDTELRASSVPVAQASGALWSTSVVDAFGSTAVDSVWNADNRLRVSVETGGSGLTDSELRATRVPVGQVSGANWSTEVTNTVTVDATGSGDVPVTLAGEAVVLGAGTAGIGKLTANSGVDIGDVDVTSSALPTGASTAAKQLADDHNVTVSGVTDSTTAIIGDKRADEADGDSNPVKIGGVARTANPTAVANGDRVSASYDDVGRQLGRPVQVRDLLQTAYVTESAVAEVAILAGVSGVFHDMVYMKGANESDAAITLDIRQTTGGTVQDTLTIPANSTAGAVLPVPIPQDHSNATWTAQNNASDNSNTIYSVTALFSKEV